MLLSHELIRQYRRDGYVFLPGVVEPNALELIGLGIERNMSNPSPWTKGYTLSGGSLFEDKCNFSVNAELQQVIYESSIVDYLAELMEVDRVWLYYDQVICKYGRTQRTGWHQDMSYYLMQAGTQVTGAWISLDPLEAAFSLEVVAGSHEGPMYNMQDFSKKSDDGTKKTGSRFDVGGGALPDIEANRAAYKIVSFKTRPGDMLVFHPQALHGGAPTAAGEQRRALSVNVFGPEIRYQARPSFHSPAFPGLDRVLKEGEPLYVAAGAGYFHQLRPLPAKRLGVLAQHDMDHGQKADAE